MSRQWQKYQASILVPALAMALIIGCARTRKKGMRSAPQDVRWKTGRAAQDLQHGSGPISDEQALGAVFSGDHHLEQHPDPSCRRDWRNADLKIDYRSGRFSESPSAYSVAKEAKRFLGVPYTYGGTGPDGMDCSAFVNRVYANLGYDLPRVSAAQADVGLAVSRLELQPGDLLFFVSSPSSRRISHVGIYAGEGKMIHAATSKKQVTVANLSSRYYQTRFFGARRIRSLPPGRYSSPGGGSRKAMLFNTENEIARRFPEGIGPCAEQEW